MLCEDYRTKHLRKLLFRFDRAFLLAACQRKSLAAPTRFLRFSFTQRTQRKRLRLNGNRAWRSGVACSAAGERTAFRHQNDDLLPEPRA